MAYSAIFVAAIVITFTQVAARPANTNVLNKRFKRSDMGETQFKLPTLLKGEDAITIKGTISNDAKSFSVKLPSITDGKACRIAYDFKTSTFDISPTLSPEAEKTTYNINTSKTITFSLALTARLEGTQSMFYVSFEANEEEKNGLFGSVPCEVKSFDDIGYVEIGEGIESVTSLNFQFA